MYTPRMSTVPPRLGPGQTLAAVSPSSPGAPICSARFERAVSWLSNEGIRVTTGSLTWNSDDETRSPRARAAEFNDLLCDEEVGALMATIGGWTALEVLPHLDYDLLARRPRIIIGYSDITAILLAVHAKSGLVTYHGPTIMPELGEWPHPPAVTADSLRSALDGTKEWTVTPASRTTHEYLAWGKDDVRERATYPAQWRWLAPGECKAPLWGGNLDTMAAMTGTGFLDPPAEFILFWESQSPLGRVRQCFAQLRQAGLLKGVRGMIVGRFPTSSASDTAAVHSWLRSSYGSTMPILTDVELGHTDPMITLPIGASATLRSGEESFSLSLPTCHVPPPSRVCSTRLEHLAPRP